MHATFIHKTKLYRRYVIHFERLPFRNCFRQCPKAPLYNVPARHPYEKPSQKFAFIFFRRNFSRISPIINLFSNSFCSNSNFVLVMAIDLIYPFALIILVGVAATKTEFLPYATGVVVLLLALNSMRSSLSSIDELWLTDY